ncbi:MAG TPA: cellulase family glycosylhydrolase, partial [Chitinophagaceae bacterium]|nr:cellulase family glycosylhydrolase [Chitinophagaceae bacterium]
MKHVYTIVFLLSILSNVSSAQSFVQRKGHQFMLNNKPYYYIGANYWYSSYLGLEKNKERGAERLRKELDFLKEKGVTNLRVLAGAEGNGQINGVPRVEPPLQPTAGKFNEEVLDGLDLLLFEMGKRNMKAVVFLSNNWEWSGGFLQYLNWNVLIEDSVLKRKLTWDEMRDYVSKFYSCTGCKEAYYAQVKFILNRTNKLSRKKYTEDPAIMAWELANEPRPMRPAAAQAFLQWNKEAAALIKSIDKNHLVTTGSEGEIGTEGMALVEEVHKDKNVDYLTIHIWPKNWSWFSDTAIAEGLPQVISKTDAYIQNHVTLANKLDKPLVIEEFGLPRNNHSFSLTS